MDTIEKSSSSGSTSPADDTAHGYAHDNSDLEAAKSPAVTTERERERRPSKEEEDVAFGSTAEIRRTQEIQHGFGILRSLRKGEEWLDAKMGVELQGIDRVPEEQKKPPSMWNIFLFWWSLNIHVGVIPLGVLGAEFGLSLKQTVGAAIVGNILGALCTAWDGTLSPKVGTGPYPCSLG